MKKTTGPYPALTVDGGGSSVVAHAGATLLLRTAQTVGLSGALSQALAPWRKPLAVHDPGKIVLDLAVSLAIGGDCLADIAQLRAAPEVFGLVASDPTVSRCIDALAADAPAALAAIDAARAQARSEAWGLAGDRAPDHAANAGRPVVVDVDATLVTAHSEKEAAAPTFKRGFGFHPLWAFVDHGAEEPVSRWRSSCAGATPAPTPSPTTSPSSAPRSRSCPEDTPEARRCWCGSTGRWHPRAARVADPPPTVLLDRVLPAR